MDQIPCPANNTMSRANFIYFLILNSTDSEHFLFDVSDNVISLRFRTSEPGNFWNRLFIRSMAHNEIQTKKKIWSKSMKTKLNDHQIIFNRLRFNFRIYLQKIRLFLKSSTVILNKIANFDLPDQKYWLES